VNYDIQFFDFDAFVLNDARLSERGYGIVAKQPNPVIKISTPTACSRFKCAAKCRKRSQGIEYRPKLRASGNSAQLHRRLSTFFNPDDWQPQPISGLLENASGAAERCKRRYVSLR
jgi:hypothetical protein